MPDSQPLDLLAIGSGTAAAKVAETCRAAGWRVAVADAREFGGTCALRGCEPKKVLWTLAEAADRARRLAEVGLAGGERVAIDWPALMAFKRGFTDPVPERRAEAFEKAGIEAIRGTARFVAPNAVEVAGRRLEARHVLIATGARPDAPGIRGAELLATSDDFLSLDRLPRRLVMLGGGYISFECAHIAARAGAAEVTILHADDRPLAQFDPDLVRRLVERSRRVGIAVELGCRAAAVERGPDGLVVLAEDGRRFGADFALHGLGRAPDLEALDLQAGGVAVEKGRLRLDRHLRSVSNPAVFAAGDAAAQGPALTPVASHDAEVVARNLLEGCRHEPDYTGVTSVVFAIPPLASVGLTEEAARGKGVPFELRQGDMADYQSVRRTREEAAAFKLLLQPGSGCVLGAHLLGPQAEEVINLFALAVRLRLPARDLGRLLSAYPSFGSNIAGMLGQEAGTPDRRGGGARPAIGIVGLGRIGGGLALSALGKGIRVVGQTRSGARPELLEGGLEEIGEPLGFRERLSPPRRVLLYVPAGPATEAVIDEVADALEPGDVIADGGNAYWGDSIRRQARLAARGIRFVDLGTSGGVAGAREGACFMAGGERDAVAALEPILRALAVEGGYVHAGPPGAGHFVKLVHNGIEFGMLQSIAEGFGLLRRWHAPLDVAGTLECWRHGSVIRSWLVDLMAEALRRDPGLAEPTAHIEDTGEVNWLVMDAMRMEAPIPVIAQAVMQLFASRGASEDAAKAVVLMRHGFGGHPFGPDEDVAKERREGRVGEVFRPPGSG